MIIDQSFRPVHDDGEVGDLQPKLKGLGTYGTVGLRVRVERTFRIVRWAMARFKIRLAPLADIRRNGVWNRWQACERYGEPPRKPEGNWKTRKRNEAELRRDYHERNRKK